MKRYDEWKLADGRNAKYFCQCEHCDNEIFVGEEIYITDKGTVHQECYMDFVDELLNVKIRYAGDE